MDSSKPLDVTTHRAPALQQTRNILAYVHLVIGTYIFLANGLVVLSVQQFVYLKTRANIYIVSLALTDMCVGVMEWGIALHNHEILSDWFDRTEWACVGIFSFAFFSVACSMFNMVLIAFDRLLYITRPFVYGRVVTSRKVKLAILGVWSLALAWGSIPFYINTYDSTSPSRHCTMQAAIPSVYRVYANVPVLFIGSVLTGVMYMIIARTAIMHKNAIYKSTPGANSVANKNPADLTEAAKAALKTMQSNMKTLKLFIIVLGLLIVCWYPYYIIEFTSDFIHISDKSYRASTALGFLNSGVNFLVYPMYDKSFRRAFKSLLCPCCVDENARARKNATYIPTKNVKPKKPSHTQPALGRVTAPHPPPPPPPPPPPTTTTNIGQADPASGDGSPSADALHPPVSDAQSGPPETQAPASARKDSSQSGSTAGDPAKTVSQNLGMVAPAADGSQKHAAFPFWVGRKGQHKSKIDSLSDHGGLHLWHLLFLHASKEANTHVPPMSSSGNG